MISEEKFLQLAKAKYANLHALDKKPTLLDYERGLVEIMNELGREIIDADMKGKTTDRRKKRPISPPSGQLK